MAHARQTTLFGGWTNEQPSRLLTTTGENSSKSGVAVTSAQRYAGKHTVSMPPSSCLVCSYCRVQECVKAAGSEFGRIKKEHPSGVAAWLQSSLPGRGTAHGSWSLSVEDRAREHNTRG